MSTNSSGGTAARLYARLTSQPVLLLFLITFAVVAWMNPAKIGLLLYGIAKVTLFAEVGAWIDQRKFPNDQPDNLTGLAQGTAWKRKAWIIIAAMLGGALLP